MRRKTLLLARAAIIAALYVVLTYITNAFGLASGVIQVRISEALSMLCVFTPAGIYGVTIGCLISNLITGCAPLDVIFGTLATLIGAIGTRILGRKSKFLAPLPTIISNTIIIPIILYYVYGFTPFWFGVVTVFIGEAISCYVFGLPLYAIVERNKKVLKLDS
ncbi:MAG: QueT transporter family protein [Saccharofermentans sp.]|nr:QueT transporter family protein [Saccharofermentans sp.]